MTVSERTAFSGLIRKKALELGFDLCGIARYRPLEECKPVLEDWLKAGMNDKMGYLARDIQKRLDPGLLFQGAKSIVVTGMSYYSENRQRAPGAPIISRYAYGIDYHEIVIPRLEELLSFVKKLLPETGGKTFCDSGPILEKAWAREAGLGWQGRHSVLINRAIGSFFFIGILILNIELEYDKPHSGDFCGDCRLCIDACPTGAINENHTIDARKCIANLTIENRGPINEDLVPFLGGRAYGCDKCQEVCPWNNHARQNINPEMMMPDEIADMTVEEWQELSAEKFDMLFSRSAIERVKYENFRRNIIAAIRSTKQNRPFSSP